MLQLTSWEHAGLKDAEEEATCEKAAVVLDNTLHHGREAKEKHVGGEPDMGPEALQHHVGRDFENDIGDEEDTQGGVVHVAREIQVRGEAVDVGVANVHTICTAVSFHGLREVACTDLGNQPRKASVYMMQRKGTTRKSILVSRRRSVV